MAAIFSVVGRPRSPFTPPSEHHYSENKVFSEDYSRSTGLGPIFVPPPETLDECQISLELIDSSLREITGFLREITENTQPADGRKSASRRKYEEKVSF